jgi:POT family proton-dependent oligopeptide transporter
VSVQALWVIILAPIMALVWTRLGRMRKEPSSPAKFALGLIFAGLAFLMLIPAARLAQSAANVRVSPMWLVGAYFIEELGELCISPVGLSIVTKLAPVRIVGLMMGVWFLSNALGNKLAGFAAGFFSSMPLDRLFGIVAAISFAAGVLLFVLIKPIKGLMGEVR